MSAPAKIDAAELLVLVDKVKELVAFIPSPLDDWAAYQRAQRGLENGLIALGAGLRRGHDAIVITLAGVRASSTGGLVGACHNWCAAARRKAV